MNNDIPCLEQTRQGNTVVFRGKYLYSKYNPTKEILRDIESRQFLPGTVVLCFSPCLCYGIKELLEKLPEDCMALGIEADRTLYDFAKEYCHQFEAGVNAGEKFHLVHPKDITKLPLLLNAKNATFSDGTHLLPKGKIKRCVAINFSAGVSFQSNFYAALGNACIESVSQFWKNRITLTRLGRRFSRNLIRNMTFSFQKNSYGTAKAADETGTIEKFPAATINKRILQTRSAMRTVSKPIIVFGAGESLSGTAEILRDEQTRSAFYVIAVDAAFSALAQRGITADAVVCEEAQVAIADAFIGFSAERRARTVIFTSITSWTGLERMSEKCAGIAFFATKYEDTNFFESLEKKGILPPTMTPLGSVGLTATEIALWLRADESVPIYVSGLDFSYSTGMTHARGTTAHTKMLCASNKLRPTGNYGAAFSVGAEYITGISGERIVTTKSLAGYAKEFCGFFAGTKNLFDARATGINIGLERRVPIPPIGELEFNPCGVISEKQDASPDTKKQQDELHAKFLSWCGEEIAAISEIRDILTGKKNMTELDAQNRLAELLAPREYLYLHFPDGYSFSCDTSFLKRVRAELDFFEKDFQRAVTDV